MLFFVLFFIVFFYAKFDYSYVINESPFQNFIIYKYEYKRFLYFIHEFHHFLAANMVNNYNENYSDVCIILPHDYLMKKNSFVVDAGIKNVCFTGDIASRDQFYKAIIKYRLAGYAGEEAFKKTSLLLNLFSKKSFSSENETISFYSLYFYSNDLASPLVDVDAAVKYIQYISLDSELVIDYIKKYDNLKKKNNFISKEENRFLKKNKLNSNLCFYLKVLFMIYYELVEEYRTENHQKKIYDLFDKNPDLLVYEIFFYQDLCSLWNHNKLQRDLSQMKNFSKNEQAMIINFMNQGSDQFHFKMLPLIKNIVVKKFSFTDYFKKIVLFFPNFLIKGAKQITSLFSFYYYN